jgi:hypothetical protein
MIISPFKKCCRSKPGRAAVSQSDYTGCHLANLIAHPDAFCDCILAAVCHQEPLRINLAFL